MYERVICLDTETTGLDPYKGHRIIEIGAVELVGGVVTKNNFHVYVNPEREVPEEAYRVHGISTDFLRNKPVIKEIIHEFVDFIGDAPLVIHNAAFDMRFINFELELLGLMKLDMSRAIDTLMLARRKFPGSPANLDALCKRFKIDLSRREKHGALLDAELLSSVYINLIGGLQTSLDSSLIHEKEEEVQGNTIYREARHFPASDEERLKHTEFMKLISNVS